MARDYLLPKPIMAPSTTSNLDRFEEDYPAQLPSRLQWLEDQLQIDRQRILLLMGVPRARAATVGARTWREIVKEYEAQADRVEHLLTHYLGYFDYDAGKARTFAQDFSRKVAAGQHQLADDIPALATASTPREQEEALLTAARQEGASLLPALANLFGTPADATDNGKGAQPHPPRERGPRQS
jgi:hypothetical protein